MIGAAAAGYTLSFPIVDSIIDALTVSPEKRAANGSGTRGGGNGGAVIPSTGGDGVGDGEGDGAGGESDTSGNGAGGSTSENCLFGLICLNVNTSFSVASSDGTNAGGDLNGSTGGSTRCFLDLICVHANVDATTNELLQNNVDTDADVDEDGVRLDTNADAHLNLDTNQDNCLLDMICLNLNADLNATSGNSAQVSLGAALYSWWASQFH